MPSIRRTKRSTLSLNSLTDPSTPVHTLILNGDIVDLWTIPFDVHPPYPNEILLSENYNNVNLKKMTSLLTQILQNQIRIIYINGNHDDFMSQEYLNQAGLSSIEHHPYKFLGNNFELHHAHEWTINNMFRPDDKTSMKAWSYYTVRSKITHFYENQNMQIPKIEENKKISKTDWLHIVEEICKAIATSTFDINLISNNAWWYEYDIDRQIGGGNPILLKQYNKYKDKEIKGGNWTSYNERSTTLSEAVELYKNDIELWLNHPNFGLEYVKNMLLSDPCLNYEHWIEKTEKQVFLLGHTHITEFKKLENVGPEKNKNILYVNSGCWLESYGVLQDLYYPVIRMFTSGDDKETVKKVDLCAFDPQSSSLEVKTSSHVPIQ